jgi:hypothetical protein
MRATLRKHLPDHVRTALRAPTRWFALSSARCLLRLFGKGRVPSSRLIRTLRYGWGNEGFSASESLLREVATQCISTRGAVLETGSGVSTVLLSYVLPADRALLALEHDDAWVERVNRYSRRGTCPAVSAQIASFAGYDWYEVPLGVPTGIGLLICDGPPGWTRGGRYGALPQLSQFLLGGATVLFDDVNRSKEQEVLEQWVDEFSISYSLISIDERAFAIAHLP